jgi:hypothetical protein
VKTVEQVEAMLKKAEQFARNVLADPEKAEEFASMGVDEYASRKGIEIRNPEGRGGSHERTNAGGMSKTEMQSLIDEVDELLGAALDPRLSREEIIERVMEASDLISGEGEVEEVEGEGDED